MSDLEDNDASPGQSLVKSGHATSLASARATDLLYLDKRGEVMSPRRTRIRSFLSQGYLIGASIATPVYLGITGGLVGGAIGLVVPVLFGRFLLHVSRIRRAEHYMQNARYDAAEREYRRIVDARLLPKVFRVKANLGLAVCHRYRGEPEAALAHYVLAGASNRQSKSHVISHQIAYGKAGVLIELGRLEEAHAILEDRKGNLESSDYLRLVHMTLQLYACLAAGEHSIPEEELHERARFALGISLASASLALLSWAHFHIGDVEQGAHLLREAKERDGYNELEWALPKLHRWILQHDGQ